MIAQLFPEIVLDLQTRGITHTYRPSSRDVLVTCPCCGANMVMDASGKPYWLCLSRAKCASDSLTFQQIVGKLNPAAGSRHGLETGRAVMARVADTYLAGKAAL